MASFVSGTYASYKAGTSKVLHWLYENASKCGYEEEAIQEVLAEQKSQGRLKGKKRKAAKAKAGGNVTSNKPTLGLPKSVKDFMVYAVAISKSEPKIKVPLWVTSMLKEVIQVRKKSARFYKRESDDTTSQDFEESNITHQYFISVLEKVLETLLASEGAEEKSMKIESTSDADEEDPFEEVTNIFEYLEIGVDTEHTLTEPTERPVSRPKVLYREEPNTEEIVWLIYCFFEDFNIAREHLKSSWIKYRDGSMDLAAVALATNTAFEMFQRAEVELMEELSLLPPEYSDEFAQPGMLHNFLYISAAQQRGQNPFLKLHPQDSYNLNLFDVADWTCLPVYIILSSFLPVIKDRQSPICKAGYFGEIDMKGDMLNPRQKFAQDKIVLLERFVPELMFLSNFTDPTTRKPLVIPGQDELTKGFHQFVRTKEIPTWLVLALQVQLDIHYILLKDTPRPYHELAIASTRTVETIREYLEFSKSMHVSTWPKNNDKALEGLIFDCEMWIKKDFLGPLRTHLYAQIGFPKAKGTHVLLKRHPLLCGMMLFRLSVVTQDIGIVLVNAWGAVPSILHLYNAAVAEHTITKSWVDLEAVILVNTEERIFIGRRPTKPNDYLKHFMLVMGHSVASFSRTARGGSRLPISSKGPRQMIALSPLAEIYHGRYPIDSRDSDAKSVALTLDAIEKLLLRTISAPPLYFNQQITLLGDADGSEATLAGVRFATKGLQINGSKQKTIAKQFSKSHKLTTIQLLNALERCVVIDSFALNVDYFSLHIRCYRLLRALQEALNKKLVKYFGPAWLEEESQLPFLVGWVFNVMAGSSQTSRALKIPEEETESLILREASEVMDEFIKWEGDIEIEKVKKLCRMFDGVVEVEVGSEPVVI